MTEQDITNCTSCYAELDKENQNYVVIDLKRITLYLCKECCFLLFVKIGCRIEKLKSFTGSLSKLDELNQAELEKTRQNEKIEDVPADEPVEDETEEDEQQKKLDELVNTLDDKEDEDELDDGIADGHPLNSLDRLMAYEPSVLVNLLDRDVIGQAEAKTALARAAYHHLLQSYCQRAEKNGELSWLAEKAPELVDVQPEKSNIMLIGPTGCGKTLLVRSLSRILELPMVTVSATNFTERGYVGNSLELIFIQLYRAAKKNLTLAQHGIVYIDEFDKLAQQRCSTRDITGLSLQQELLTLIEGEKLAIDINNNRRQADFLNFDTRNVLFILGGAFSDLLNKLVPREGIGFVGNNSQVEPRPVTHQDFFGAGFIPELIGRIPIITQFDELDEDALYRILIEPRNAIVKQYRKLAMIKGEDFVIEERRLREIARRARKTGIGARALRSLIEREAKEMSLN